ncbi:ATP-binding protein [Cohnella caldifontis]|uniref:ATP-binding protein n=1 Tax=Cohnella caldifontis TaxID=3027471 RepID=UPI0023ED7677|nr:ATP-binding protein [Cohnella sp. YIM B05605]
MAEEARKADVLKLAGEELEELGELHRYFDRLSQRENWPVRLANDLLLCCEELLTNTILYGYPDGRTPRSIVLEVASGRESVVITLSDDAMPYNPLLGSDPDLTLGVEDRPIGGLGVYFVKQIMDEVRYELTEKGNRLILRKTFERTGEEQA